MYALKHEIQRPCTTMLLAAYLAHLAHPVAKHAIRQLHHPGIAAC